MLILRKILFRILGFERYLKVTSFIFLKTFHRKCYLKPHSQVRFLSKIIREGDHCLDIGANLGYFSIPLAKIVGKKGRVWACEPITTYQKILKSHLKHYRINNVQVVPSALGEQHNQTIQLQIPKVQGVVRHGRAKIGKLSEGKLYRSVSAHMVNPLIYFKSLTKLNFIKCDVEGYEAVLIPLMMPLIKKYTPVLEIEISESSVFDTIQQKLKEIGYTCYFLENQYLHPFFKDSWMREEINEYYFLPRNHSLNKSISCRLSL